MNYTELLRELMEKNELNEKKLLLYRMAITAHKNGDAAMAKVAEEELKRLGE